MTFTSTRFGLPRRVNCGGRGKTYVEICEELNRLSYRTRTGKPWRHPQQII